MAVALAALVVGVMVPLDPAVTIAICSACVIAAISMIRKDLAQIVRGTAAGNIAPDFYVVLAVLAVAASATAHATWQAFVPPHVRIVPRVSGVNQAADRIVLWMEATGPLHNVSWWIYPRPTTPPPPGVDRDWSNWNSMESYNSRITIPYVPGHSAQLIGLQLEKKAGDYAIDISSDEGSFSEQLTISAGPRFKWSCSVTKGDKVVHVCPDIMGHIE